ncbi:MAG: nuclear transport factor 2 family protein [Woeseiaceae bacterium]|nr:nuclear transport factor 2 family protein [Woeseiaceae bacterium]
MNITDTVTTIRRVIVIAAVAMLAPAQAEQPQSAADAAAEVRAAEQAFADAFASRDLDRFASFIHADAVFTGRDGNLQGREAVMAVWGRFFESDEAPFSWAPERVLASSDGNMGATTGPVRDRDGRHVGAFASTWARQEDGSWQVVFDVSPSCPPPER